MTITGSALEKGMAMHSSILACRISWTEALGKAIVHGITKLDVTKATGHIHHRFSYL